MFDLMQFSDRHAEQLTMLLHLLHRPHRCLLVWRHDLSNFHPSRSLRCSFRILCQAQTLKTRTERAACVSLQGVFDSCAFGFHPGRTVTRQIFVLGTATRTRQLDDPPFATTRETQYGKAESQAGQFVLPYQRRRFVLWPFDLNEANAQLSKTPRKEMQAVGSVGSLRF